MAPPLKRALRRVRQIGTFWVAEQTLAHLEAIRIHELGLVTELLPSKGKLLELGAGTGWQAKVLEERGYDVRAVDLPSSGYRDDRVWNVTEYDGKRLPYDDRSFDIVFSSNVLEHVPHLREFQDEIHRVLKPDGCAIHILPSSAWSLWTSLTHVLKFWTIPKVHGEHASNALIESAYFRCGWWTRRFQENGWTVVMQRPTRLFYTGYSIMDSRLSMRARSVLSRVLGSACNIFVLKPAGRTGRSGGP